MVRYQFSRQINKDFAATLRKRVNAHFKESGKGRNANAQMVTKVIVGMTTYFSLYAVLMLSGSTSLGFLFSLYIGMGFCMAFIGLSIMHDSLHGSFSKKKSLNTLVGFSAVSLGVSDIIWKIQHNVLHHTYTNIEDADEDIMPRFIMRFSPNQPKMWFHRYQHIYCWLVYGISTIIWTVAKDFIKLGSYKKDGLIKPEEYNKQLAIMVFRKILYHGVFFVLPLIFLEVSAGMTILMWVTMHFVAGITLSLVFQTAHITPTSEYYILEDGGEVQENFYAHQLFTTANYATKNRVLNWLVGGLNFQVEHHLFPNICHVHYPGIQHIVKETAAEYNLPYYDIPTFWGAVGAHYRMLRELGKGDVIEPAYRSKVDIAA